MVHLYRAAPESSDTNTYLMYGLGAVALIIGLIFLYRRQKKSHHKNDDEKRQTVSPSTRPSTTPSTPANMTPVNVQHFTGRS